MKKSRFGRQLVVLSFLFVFVTGLFALVTVGLRQRIATIGERNRAMEQRLVEVERMLSRQAAEIAIALSPAHLEAQNAAFQLGLRAPREDQIVRVNAETQVRFVQRRSEQLGSGRVEPLKFVSTQYH